MLTNLTRLGLNEVEGSLATWESTQQFINLTKLQVLEYNCCPRESPNQIASVFPLKGAIIRYHPVFNQIKLHIYILC